MEASETVQSNTTPIFDAKNLQISTPPPEQRLNCSTAPKRLRQITNHSAGAESHKPPQIKSKARVRDRGEVFTQPREVNNILALTQATSNRYWRFLEPACGNGNFLEAILRQRLDHLKQDKIEWHHKNREFSVLKVLSTVYGVDIAEDNIAECRKRLTGVVFEYLPKKSSKGFLLALDEILRTNLIAGDMLNGKEFVFFVEYSTPVKGRFKRRVYALTDMENGIDRIIAEMPPVRFEDMQPIKIPDKESSAPPGEVLQELQENLFGDEKS